MSTCDILVPLASKSYSKYSFAFKKKGGTNAVIQFPIKRFQTTDQAEIQGRAPAGAGKLAKNIQMNTMSAAGRSLLAGSLMDEEISQEELLVGCKSADNLV